MLYARDAMYRRMFLATVLQMFVRQTVHACMTEHFKCQNSAKYSSSRPTRRNRDLQVKVTSTSEVSNNAKQTRALPL